jgi:hypothetical protein
VFFHTFFSSFLAILFTGVLVMSAFASRHFLDGTGGMRGELVQVHHPQDFFSQPHGSCSGNSCLTLSSISYFVKLEMFAIAGR